MENAVEKIALCMRKNKIRNFEIIISEDGSTDGSGEIAKRLASNMGFVRAISFPKRKGKGKAIEDAIRLCRFEKIIFTDVDLSGGTGSFMHILHELRHADLAVGNRYSKKSASKRHLLRHILSIGFRLLVNILFFHWFDDYQCGVKGFNKKSVEKLMPLIPDKGWLWDTELILEATRQKMRISQVPVCWAERTSASLKVAPTALELFFGIIKYRLVALHGNP